MVKKCAFWALGLLGMFLTMCNIWGAVQGDRLWVRPDVVRSIDHKNFSADSFAPGRRPCEDEFAYAQRMTRYINSHTTHAFAEQNTIGNIPLVVMPFFRSWPLWLVGLWASTSGQKFTVEFCSPEKGLARGYGYCSQRALILQNILRANGIQAHARDLQGHVVCTARINGKDVLLDADYGLASPHSLEDFHKRPELLLEDGNPDLESEYPYLKEVYQAGRWHGRENREYACVSDFQLFLWDLLQWGVPLLFIALFVVYGIGIAKTGDSCTPPVRGGKLSNGMWVLAGIPDRPGPIMSHWRIGAMRAMLHERQSSTQGWAEQEHFPSRRE